VDESIVAIEQTSARRRHVHAFLHLIEQQAILLFGRPALGDIANNVDRPFLGTSLLAVRRSRNRGETAEARVGTFGDCFASARAVGAAGPLAKTMGQYGFTSAADHIGRRLAYVFKQNLVGFDNSEIGVMGQNDVMDRVESVSPLALRAEGLLLQPEVLDRDS